jgi:hypothetical protein
MNTISPTTTIVSAILIVVVLIIALSLRGKIKRNERGNEFFPWEREQAQGDRFLGAEDEVIEDEEEDDEGEDYEKDSDE